VPISTANGVPFQLTAFGEVLADRRNRVTLDRHRRDAWGLPIARIACTYGDNEEAMARDQLALFDELAELCGLDLDGHVTWAVPGTSAHEVGGARMGADPRTSVVDRYNRLWAAPNVLVTDGSCFVSAPCQNPTLTMMALTIRACRHLVRSQR
jgi:choline dehydrogenase-like flavoprotein